jgi:hypothetical protein
MGNWIFTYATTTRVMEAQEAALLNSTYWGTLTVGRLAFIPIASRLRPRFILMTALGGSLLSALLLILGSGTRRGGDRALLCPDLSNDSGLCRAADDPFRQVDRAILCLFERWSDDHALADRSVLRGAGAVGHALDGLDGTLDGRGDLFVHDELPAAAGGDGAGYRRGEG